MKNHNRSQTHHICIGVTSTGTDEHIDELIREALDLHLSICIVQFTEGEIVGNHRNSIEKNKFATSLALLGHMRKTQSLALFLQSPYSEHYPEWLTEAKNLVPIAYAGYGLALSNWTDGHFKTPLILAASYLFASGEYDFRGYESHSTSARVIRSGNPLLFRLRSLMDKKGKSKLPSSLLWAPHWTDTWVDGTKGFSRWRECLPHLYEWAIANSTKNVNIRPHPFLRKEIDSYLDENQSTNDDPSFSLLKKFLILENVNLSENTMIEDILTNDVLVTEGVSIIAYWASTGKAMYVVRDIDSPKLNKNGEQILVNASGIGKSNDLSLWLRQIVDKKTRINKKLIKPTERVYPSYPESPLQIWLQGMAE